MPDADPSSRPSIVDTDITYEQLALIEDDLEDVEKDLMRKQWRLSKDIYSNRSKLVKQIPHFWIKAMQASPTAMEQYFNMTDSSIIEKHLVDVDIVRFELGENFEKGDPRSFSIKLTFTENEWFEDKELEKKFWYRYAKDGWSGYVSEPVKINWKPGKDTTEGLLDAAIALWEARKKTEASGPNVEQKTLPEYKKVVRIRNKTDNDSFFRFFGFVSGKRYVSVQESEQAYKAEQERRAKSRKGEGIEPPSEDQLDDYDPDGEIMPEADDVATTFAEDIFPNAIKYFTVAQEMEELGSDFDFEEDFTDTDDDMPIDIRDLVGKGKGKDRDSPPTKKRKT